MNTNYSRVIPRDLFNEAKLLKCIGRLVLLIHEAKGHGITFDHDEEPFNIGLLDEGCLSIQNIAFELNETPLFFKSLYNSKMNWPLYAEHDFCDYLVFDEQGEYTAEFIEFINTLK